MVRHFIQDDSLDLSDRQIRRRALSHDTTRGFQGIDAAADPDELGNGERLVPDRTGDRKCGPARVECAIEIPVLSPHSTFDCHQPGSHPDRVEPRHSSVVGVRGKLQLVPTSRVSRNGSSELDGLMARLKLVNLVHDCVVKTEVLGRVLE